MAAIYCYAEILIQCLESLACGAVLLFLVKVYYVAVESALKAFKLRAVAVGVYAYAVAVATAAITA